MSTAVIVAGGRGRRLGGVDKTQLIIGGQRILDRQLAVLRGLTDDLLLVSHDGHPVDVPGLRIVNDLLPERGALIGLYTALAAAPSSPVIVLACDMPFVTESFVARLLEIAPGCEATVPRTAEGYQPFCASYSRTCAAIIRRRVDAGRLKVTELLPEIEVCEMGPEDIAPHDPHGLLFFNVNTVDDYARAQDVARRFEPHSLPQPRA